MFGAIGAAVGLAAAEGEFRVGRVTDRPFAHRVAQRQDRRRRAVHQQRGQGLDRRDALDGEGGHRQARRGGGRRSGGGCDRAIRQETGLRPGQARRALDRAGRGGAAGQAEAVDLADHRIAGDPAQLLGDLGGRMALGPEFLEGVHPLVVPRHVGSLPHLRARPVAGCAYPYMLLWLYAPTVLTPRCRIRGVMKHNMQAPLSTGFYILWSRIDPAMPLASAGCIAYVQ